jgi:hypothetical protein
MNLHAARILVCAGLLAACLVGAEEARADGRDEATASFRRGAEAYARRDYRAAAIAFEAAQRALPNASTAYNAGLAWERVPGEELKAAQSFDVALAAGLDGAQGADARRRLEQIDQRLGRLEVLAPSEARIAIDGEAAALAPDRRRVVVGEHEVVATFNDGHSDKKTVTAARGVVTRVIFEAPATAPPSAAVPAPVAVASDVAAPKEASTVRMLGWAGLAGGVVLGGAATYLVVTGMSARDDFDASGRHDADLRVTAITNRTWGTVSLVGAIALTVAGVALLLTPHGTSPATGARAARAP